MANSFEYYMTEANDSFPGTLDHNEKTEAIGNMNEQEIVLFSMACKGRDKKAMGEIILESIERQYAKTIEQIAQRYYRDDREFEGRDAA